MRNLNCYNCFHRVISNGCISSFDFFYSVVVSSFLTFLEFKSWELNVTRCIVLHSFKSLTIFILKNKAEFVSFKLTAFQTFREVEFYWNRNVHNTFFSWFVWFLHCLACWIVLVNDLSRSVFNIRTTFNSIFHCCWDVELVVTSKRKLSGVDHWSIFCVSKWLSQVRFRSCRDHTVFNLDIKFSSHIFACYRVVSFDVCNIDVKLVFFVVISNTNRLDVVRFSELSCIQPYLVNNLIATFHCLSIDVSCFIIVSLISVRICVCFRNLVCQFFIIIKKWFTSKVEFLSVQDVFLWVELWSFWRSHLVVKFFIRNVANFRDQNFSFSVVWNCDCYIRFHCVVCNGCVCSFNFFYCVVVNAFLTFLEFKFRELNVTWGIVLNSFKSLTFWIFKHEAEFVSFKLTAFQTFSEVEFHFNWNVIYTFFSWFVWFFNCLAYWVVVVYYLSRSIFDVCTTRNIFLNSCWNIKLVVTSEFKFSCVNDLSVFSIAKWLSEAIFKCCSHHTVVHSDIEFICNISSSYWIVSFNSWSFNVDFCLIVVIWDSYWLDVVLVSCVKFSCIQPYLVNKFLTWFNWFSIDIRCFVIRCVVRIWVRICICDLVCQLFIVI